MLCKRFILGLGAAALALLASGGLVRADGPVMVGPSGPCCAAGAGGPAEGCCKSCISAPVQKKVVLRHYGVKSEDFCVCKPTFLGGLFNLQEALEKDRNLYVGRGPCDQECGECGGCCGNCGTPRVKKYLVIHIREHNECEMKCQTPEQIAAVEAARPPAAPLKVLETPKAAPSENPQPRTPQLDPGK
jgi:hypothetical protein